VRTRAALVLVLVVAVLAGCGQASNSTSSPHPTSIPTAVSYRDVPALVAAIRAAGQPQLSDVSVGTFPEKLVPAGAHAQRGAFGVAVPGEEAPWFTAAGVFPDVGTMQYGVVYGRHMAVVGFHAPAIWQLRGPNWFLWGVHKQSLEAVRSAIGGELGQTRLTAPIPLARLSALARRFRPKEAWWTTLSRGEAERVLGHSLQSDPDLTYVVLMKGEFTDASGNAVAWAVSAGRPDDPTTRAFGTPPQTYGHGWTALDLASPEASP
jgi:hypothetical protein